MSTVQLKIESKYHSIKNWVIAILLPLVLFSLFLVFQDVNPIEIYQAMYRSVFTDIYGFGEVFIMATPFILTGLATALPARAGLMNVGGEGQLAIGALFTTFAAVFVLDGVPGWIGIPLLIVVAAVGGALWSGIAAFLKVKGKMNETITTVLLNYVAFYVVGFFVHGALKDPDSFNWPFSPQIHDALRLPLFPGTRIHIGIVIAIVLALLISYITMKTRWGFFLRIVGSNPIAALRSGFNVNRIQILALLAGGALAGIAGMIEITGIEGRLRPTTGVDYGYIGFLAAWMARNHTLWLILTSLIIGVISVSGNSLEITSGLPASAVHILMALVLISILALGRRVKA